MGLTLSKLTQWRCFFRSLFLQAGFSSESMQSLGLVYALSPALLVLYPDPSRRRAAFARHLTPFNTHPYVAAAIVGGILFHEQRLARGEEGEEEVERFKALLMGPLAALGDGFFWLSLRPAVGALSVALVPVIGGWAVAFYVVAYNIVHFTARWRLFRFGLSLGGALVPKLAQWRVPVWARRLRVLAAGVVGGVASWLAVKFGVHPDGSLEPALGGASLAFGVVVVFLLWRKVNPYLLLYGSAALVIVLAVLGVV
jgi:mannose PTS system EIID component